MSNKTHYIVFMLGMFSTAGRTDT